MIRRGVQTPGSGGRRDGSREGLRPPFDPGGSLRRVQELGEGNPVTPPFLLSLQPFSHVCLDPDHGSTVSLAPPPLLSSRAVESSRVRRPSRPPDHPYTEPLTCPDPPTLSFPNISNLRSLKTFWSSPSSPPGFAGPTSFPLLLLSFLVPAPTPSAWRPGGSEGPEVKVIRMRSMSNSGRTNARRDGSEGSMVGGGPERTVGSVGHRRREGPVGGGGTTGVVGGRRSGGSVSEGFG